MSLIKKSLNIDFSAVAAKLKVNRVKIQTYKISPSTFSLNFEAFEDDCSLESGGIFEFFILTSPFFQCISEFFPCGRKSHQNARCVLKHQSGFEFPKVNTGFVI